MEAIKRFEDICPLCDIGVSNCLCDEIKQRMREME